MTAYGFVISAYVYDLLEIGLIGNRGRIILALIGCGLAAAWIQGPPGWIGLTAGVGTVLVTRRLREWLRHEGGWQIVAALALESARWTAGLVGDMVRRACEILLPHPREGAPMLPVNVPDPVPPPGDTAYATPSMMRWTPGWAPPTTSGDTAQGRVLAPVETYADILGTVLAGEIGFNEGFRRAAAAFGVSKSKYARDMRALRREAA